MYTNHRVKKKDFVKLVNYHRHKRNLYPIKSSTNVHNHSRPCNKRSKPAKLHVGLGLFCVKKPPKTENDENELTHHQQAHKKNIIHLFCDAEREDEARHVVEISMDDKAYMCQGAVQACLVPGTKRFTNPAITKTEDNFLSMIFQFLW